MLYGSSESTSCGWGRPGFPGRSARMCRRWRSRQTCSTVTRGSNRACCTRSSRVCPKSSCGVVLGQRNWCAAATKYVINSAERLECSSLMPPWLRRAGSPLLMTKSRYSNAGRLLHHHHWCVDADVGGCFSTVKQFDGQRLRLPSRHGEGDASPAGPRSSSCTSSGNRPNRLDVVRDQLERGLGEGASPDRYFSSVDDNPSSRRATTSC